MVKDLLAPFDDKWPEGTNFNMQNGEKVTAFEWEPNIAKFIIATQAQQFWTFETNAGLLTRIS